MSKKSPTKSAEAKAEARSSEKQARLGTQMRGRLAEAYDARGHSRGTLNYHYSPKCRRDVVLMGHAELGHFLTVEYDARIVEVDYAPRDKVKGIAGDELGEFIHASIKLRDGTKVWRHISAENPGDKHDVIEANLNRLIAHKTHPDLPDRYEKWIWEENRLKPQLIHNSLRMVSWLAQAREWPLLEESKKILALVAANGEIAASDVMALDSSPAQALYLAAMSKLVLSGQLDSDLTHLPLSPISRLYKLEGVRHEQ